MINVRTSIKEAFGKSIIIINNHFIFIILITILLHFNKTNSLMFHTSVEIFSTFFAFGMLMFALNTYQINKNDFFMFLGTGYTFVGAMDLFHIFSFSELNIINNIYYDMTAKFWLAGRIIELCTFLFSIRFLYKNSKKPNYFVISIIYLIVFMFFLFGIIYFNIFPHLRIENQGLTHHKIITEYIIIAGFVICLIIFSMTKKTIDKKMLYYVQNSLIIKIISELCFTMYVNDSDFTFVLGHFLKVASLYFMYKGIIANGLQRPLDIMINNLNQADWLLKNKEHQRKYMEEAILYNEHCYETIINQSGDGIIIQIDNKIVFANSTAAKFYGDGNVDMLIGMDVFNFVVEERINEVRHRFDLI